MLENNYFNLLLGVPDTDFAKLIEESTETGVIYNEISQRIEIDLDINGLLKKQERKFDIENRNLDEHFGKQERN